MFPLTQASSNILIQDLSCPPTFLKCPTYLQEAVEMLKLTGKKVKLKMCRYMRGLKFQQQQQAESEEGGVYRLTAVYDRGDVMTQDTAAHCNMSSDTDTPTWQEGGEMKEIVFNKENILVSGLTQLLFGVQSVCVAYSSWGKT